MTARFGPRFGAESALIIGAAVVAYLLELSWPAVAAVVFGAWLAIAVFEVVAARAPATERGPSRPEIEADTSTSPAPEPPPVPAPVRAAAAAAPTPAPVAPAAAVAIRTVAKPPPAAPETPPPVPSGGPAAPEPEPVAAPPAPVLEAPVLETPPPGPPTPEPSTALPTPRAENGAWNLWALERLARDQAGHDPVRDEERSFLLMYLREFADAEGRLPPEFDGLVRDSFGDLVAPAP